MSFWRGARVLVTGGGGFIGSHLVGRLLADGATVTATGRRAEPAFHLVCNVNWQFHAHRRKLWACHPAESSK